MPPPSQQQAEKITSPSNAYVRVSTGMLQGRRKTMEDRLVVASHTSPWFGCAVYDGHGGAQTASQLADSDTGLLARILRQLNRDDGGSTNHSSSSSSGDDTTPCTRCGSTTQGIDIAHVIRSHIRQFDIELHTSLADGSGSTVCMAVMHRQLMPPHPDTNGSCYCCCCCCCWIVNIGDSRAAYFSAAANRQSGQSLRHLFSSTDHKPDNVQERQRIILSGGRITSDNGDTPRVDGNLALSRAMGDFSLKLNRHGILVLPPPTIRDGGGCDGNNNINDSIMTRVISTPEIYCIRRQQRQQQQQQQQQQTGDVLVLCTDGVWDVMDSDDIRQTIESCRQRQRQNIATALVHDSIVKRHSSDNCSAIVVEFN
jgi:serine/threonine protein phosphatase PrpC